jgi:hypothetical protein
LGKKLSPPKKLLEIRSGTKFRSGWGPARGWFFTVFCGGIETSLELPARRVWISKVLGFEAKPERKRERQIENEII